MLPKNYIILRGYRFENVMLFLYFIFSSLYFGFLQYQEGKGNLCYSSTHMARTFFIILVILWCVYKLLIFLYELIVIGNLSTDKSNKKIEFEFENDIHNFYVIYKEFKEVFYIQEIRELELNYTEKKEQFYKLKNNIFIYKILTTFILPYLIFIDEYSFFSLKNNIIAIIITISILGFLIFSFNLSVKIKDYVNKNF